jgi:mRNA-degrading endonuclease RelE of RelBE toxin-antitoxin system
VAAASQIYYKDFDVVLFQLPPRLRERIEAKIDAVGLDIQAFPHHRLKGSDRYRLRVGSYRIIYTFSQSKTQSTCWLLDIGAKSIALETSNF